MADKSYTAPWDPRFPNSNQTKHCWYSFVEYQQCIKQKGEDAPICEEFKKNYTALCPSYWIEKWTDQISAGTFPVQF